MRHHPPAYPQKKNLSPLTPLLLLRMTARTSRNRLFRFFLLLLLLSGFFLLSPESPTAAAQELTIYTEEFPPYNYTEKNHLTGVSTEVVRAVTERAGYSYQIISQAWALSYEMAQRQPNAMVYSTSRRPGRENLFQWVGKLIPAQYSVFARRDSGIRLASLEEMKDYRVGTSRDDARETFLLSRGFSPGENLLSLSGRDANRRNLQRLLNRKIDLWPMPDAVAYHLVRSLGLDPEETIERVYPLEELSTGGYWLAVGPDTPDGIVQDLQESLDSLKADGTYGDILTRWGLTP